MNTLTLGSWLTPAIVLVSGLGCASSPGGSSSTVVEETITTTTTTTTVIAIAQPTTRPKVARPAATQPAKSPPKPVIALKPKITKPAEPLAEMWDGKGKCEGVASFYA